MPSNNTWNVVVGPLTEYLMRENCALQRQLQDLEKKNAKLAGKLVENTRRYAIERCNAQRNLQIALHRIDHLGERLMNAKLKKSHAMRYLRNVNNQNKRFQQLAKQNGANVRMRALPESFLNNLERDETDESENEETTTEASDNEQINA